MSKKKRFWLSYDLGVKGDYSSLYTWLDSMQAKECGNSVATFDFEYKDKYLPELKKSLEDNIKLSKNDRIYVVWRKVDPKTKSTSVQGRFIIGKRKPSPWEGYAQGSEDSTDEES